VEGAVGRFCFVDTYLRYIVKYILGAGEVAAGRKQGQFRSASSWHRRRVVFSFWKQGGGNMSSIPMVVLVGTSGSGKTTFLEKLIKELKSRHLKVGTIKHDVHGFEMDKPGKDTWRHARAGADAVAISSPTKIAVVRRVEEELELDRVAELIGPVDIILVEGYKRAAKAKIEINRTAYATGLLSAPEELTALVSDAEWDIGVPTFGLEDAKGVADLLVGKYGLSSSRLLTGMTLGR
jgi:molybdopterin-guanine dinucleotide biosynthesis adapter protein